MRPAGSANRGSVVVLANERHDSSTASVETSATPLAAIVRATSASSWKPCSSESTPASAPTRAPGSSPEWAVDLGARDACASSTTARTSPTVNGEVSRSGPSR